MRQQSLLNFLKLSSELSSGSECDLEGAGVGVVIVV